MESGNVNEYEHVLELKQRQIAEQEKTVSQKLRENWQRLQKFETSKNSEETKVADVFRELRKSPGLQKQLIPVENRIAELKNKVAEQRIEQVGLRKEIKIIKNQSERIQELLQKVKCIKSLKAGNVAYDEVIEMTILKNQKCKALLANEKMGDAGREEEITADVERYEGFENDAKVFELLQVNDFKVPDGATFVRNGEDSLANYSGNIFDNSCKKGKKDSEGEQRTGRERYRQEKTEAKKLNLEIKSGNESFQVSLKAGEMGLEASISADNSRALNRVSAEKIRLIRRLKEQGYEDVLLNFAESRNERF